MTALSRTDAVSSFPRDIPLPRLARFAVVGATCAALQLALLFALVNLGAAESAANAIAFAASAQANFALSATLTWGDRPAGGAFSITGRWARYNLVAFAGLSVNHLAFVALLALSHYLVAGALAIGVTAACSFLLGDRFVFRGTHGAASTFTK